MRKVEQRAERCLVERRQLQPLACLRHCYFGLSLTAEANLESSELRPRGVAVEVKGGVVPAQCLTHPSEVFTAASRTQGAHRSRDLPLSLPQLLAWVPWMQMRESSSGRPKQAGSLLGDSEAPTGRKGRLEYTGTNHPRASPPQTPPSL